MTETKYKRVQGYICCLSNGVKIQIDEDEVPKLLEGINKGKVVVVRQGIINPSYFVALEKDRERIRAFLDDTKYNDEKSIAKRGRGMEALESIFSGTPLAKLLEANQPKKLGQ